jgi:hypothetical protein
MVEVLGFVLVSLATVAGLVLAGSWSNPTLKFPEGGALDRT